MHPIFPVLQSLSKRIWIDFRKWLSHRFVFTESTANKLLNRVQPSLNDHFLLRDVIARAWFTMAGDDDQVFLRKLIESLHPPPRIALLQPGSALMKNVVADECYSFL